MQKWIPLLFIIMLFSCKEKSKGKRSNSATQQAVAKAGRNPNKFWYDTSYRLLPCGLYINSKGELAYKDFDKPACDSCSYGDVFITNAYICKNKWRKDIDRTDDDYVYIPLKDLVDTSSARYINSNYFKDRKRVFFFLNWQEGGLIVEVEGADIKSFNAYKEDSMYRLGFDKFHFYDSGEIMPDEEAKKYGFKRF